jgi:hypothetical protein
MHISCTETNTVSKETKARFHMTHVIKEFHWVHPHWFPSIWYVPCKPCTYLASRLALSPNISNRASTWASSSRSTIRCVKNGFWDYGALGTNYALIAPKLRLSPNRLKRDSIWHTSSRSSIGCVQIDFLTYGMFHANCATILHQDYNYIRTDQIEPPLEPLQLRVPSGVSKMVS